MQLEGKSDQPRVEILITRPFDFNLLILSKHPRRLFSFSIFCFVFRVYIITRSHNRYLSFMIIPMLSLSHR